MANGPSINNVCSEGFLFLVPKSPVANWPSMYAPRGSGEVKSQIHYITFTNGGGGGGGSPNSI